LLEIKVFLRLLAFTVCFTVGKKFTPTKALATLFHGAKAPNSFGFWPLVKTNGNKNLFDYT